MSESFANKPPSNPDKDTFYTMGGLENLPTQEPAPIATAAPGFDLGQFIGSVEQLAQLYPGIQNRPEYDPGLSDIRYTRSFGGLGEPGSSFYSPSGAGNAPAPFQEQIVYQQPILQPQDQSAANEALLSGLLGMDWSGAYEDYLNKLRAQAQDINISNVFTPTNVNYQTQTQRQQQQQSMNGTGQSQEQDSDDDSQDDGFSLQDILDSIDLGDDTDSDITDGALDSNFFTDTTTDYLTDDTTDFTDDITDDTIDLTDDTVDITDDVTDDTTDFTTDGGTKTTTVDGGTKVDTIKGGKGNDFLNTDDTTIDFDIGRPDTVDGGTTVDTIKGGTGNDTITGGTGNDTIIGGNGNDTVDGGTTVGTIIGGNGNDTITGGNGNTTVVVGPTEAELKAKADREATVKQAYEAVFGRSDVDQEGLDYWTGELAAGKSPTDLLRDLVSGAQGADIQAAQNTDTVSKLYEDLLGRAPDAEGLSYYRSQLAAGASPEQVARNLISGAKAGSEASKISQEEYDRYFKQPTQTETNPPASTSLTAEQLAQFASANAGNSELVNSLQKFADDYYANNIMSANFSPDDFRSNFIYEAISQPDVLSKLVGESAASQFLTLGGGGEGDSSIGFDINAIAREIAGSLDSEAFNELANSVGKLTDISSDVADFIGLGGDPVTGMITSLISGDSFAESAANVATTLLTNAAIDMSASALAALGIPGAGPFISAALVLDSVLSDALGYESPIQDGISWISTQIEKGVEWIGDVFGDIFGNIGDFFGGLFAEGGLVDLPGDSMYNDNTQGVLPDIEGYARGGIIPLPGGGKIAKGPGGGLDDLIPTSIDGRRAAALSDGEFVIPADVVSMMGDGSTNAGSKRLYDLVRQVRQAKTGTSRQAGPLQVGKILERTMR
jgi:Ca2+-binding RTX toxin-like protein